MVWGRVGNAVVLEDTEQSAVARVFIEDDVLTGGSRCELLDTRFGGCKAFYCGAPKQMTVRPGFENIQMEHHCCLLRERHPLYQFQDHLVCHVSDSSLRVHNRLKTTRVIRHYRNWWAIILGA